LPAIPEVASPRITRPGLAAKLDSSSRSLTICKAIRLRFGVPCRSAWAIIVTWFLTLAGIAAGAGRLRIEQLVPEKENCWQRRALIWRAARW